MATYFRKPIDLKHPTLSTMALVPFQSINRIRIQQDQRSPKLTLKETTFSKSNNKVHIYLVSNIQSSHLHHNQKSWAKPYADILTWPNPS